MFIQALNALLESNSEMINLNVDNISSFRSDVSGAFIVPVTEFCMVNGTISNLKLTYDTWKTHCQTLT